MPLQQGTTGGAISANIGELINAGHPPAQAAAIAYRYAEGQDRAAGVCYRAGDSVLLLLRAPSAADYPLTWCFPGGGIDEGETPEQAAIRESTEEIGYTPETPLRLIDWLDGFSTFAIDVEAPFVPTLNAEHLGYAWVPLATLPTPMHPGCELTLQRAPLTAPAALAMDARSVDGNGWFEVKANPISKAGVFPYSGRQLGLEGEDANKIFQVLRPPEELGDPECVASFKLLPWIDEHVMLGPAAQKLTPRAVSAEEKGVQGVIGEEVFFQDGTLFANIKAFSSTLAALIEAGKRELSAGYRCIYDMTAGVWNGQRYDAVQRKIRGNHLALVKEGRMGPDVAVMDRLTFSFDATEATNMAGETTEGTGNADMSLSEITAAIKQIMPAIGQIGEIQKALAALAPQPGGEVVEDKEPKPAPGATATPAAAAAGEGGEGTPAGTAMDEATLVKRIAARDKLAAQISAQVGTFDHAEKTFDEVVAYGCEKLGIKAEKGQEAATLAGFLQAKPATTPSATVALDAADPAPKAGSFVAKHLTQKEG